MASDLTSAATIVPKFGPWEHTQRVASKGELPFSVLLGHCGSRLV
jgi:hypothetical protein